MVSKKFSTKLDSLYEVHTIEPEIFQFYLNLHLISITISVGQQQFKELPVIKAKLET